MSLFHRSRTRSQAKVRAAATESLEGRRLLSAWFVSTGGSDAASGSIDAPLATITQALNRAAPGDSINLRAGTYNLASTLYIDKSDLTIRGYNGEVAKIVASNTNAGIVNAIDIGGSNNIKLLNLDVSGGYHYTFKADGGDNLLISGSKLHDSGADVVKLAPGTNYSVIENSEIYNSGRRDPSNAEGVDAVRADYAILRGNYIHDITTNGIYYKGGSVGTLIERNRVTRTGFSGIVLGQSTDAEFFDDATNPEHYENIDGTVRNNIVWDVEGAGVAAWAALRPQIYNNTMYDVASTYFGGLLVQAEAGRASTDVTMYNNIVVVAGSRPALNVRAAGLTGFLKTDNNFFHSLSGTVQIVDEVHGYYGGLSGWQSRGYDTHSYAGDPGLDAANGFHLAASSAAINRGLTVSSVTEDFDRQARPYGGAYDIGADEVSVTTTSTEPAPTTTEPAPTTAEPAPTTTEPAPTTTEPTPIVTSPTYVASWDNIAFAPQRGVFTVEFDATPAMNNMEMIMGLSAKATKSPRDLTAVARFNANGTIDASSGAYRADATMRYVAGTTYHFKFVVDMNRHTFDLFVSDGVKTVQVANDYAYRYRSTVTQLANLASYNKTGDATLSGVIATPVFA